MLGWSRPIFSLRLIIPHYWVKILLYTLPSVPWILRFSCLVCGNKHSPWFYIHSTIPSNPAQEVSSYVNVWVLSWILQGDLYRSRVLSQQFSLLQYSVLLTLSACVSLDFKEYVLNSRSLPTILHLVSDTLHHSLEILLI